jgi:hypothetical protein
MGTTCVKPPLILVNSLVSIVYKVGFSGGGEKLAGTCGSFCKSLTGIYSLHNNVFGNIHAIHSTSNSNRFYI